MHGPHQLAKKSITTTPLETTSSNCTFVIISIISPPLYYAKTLFFTSDMLILFEFYRYNCYYVLVIILEMEWYYEKGRSCD